MNIEGDVFYSRGPRPCGRCGRITQRHEAGKLWRGGVLRHSIRRHTIDGSGADEDCRVEALLVSRRRGRGW